MTKQRQAQPVATDAPRRRKELRERYGPFWEFRNRFYWVAVAEARLLLRDLGLPEDCWQCIRLRVVDATKGGLQLRENQAEVERFGLSKLNRQSLPWRAVRAAAVVNFAYRAVDPEVIEAIDTTGLNHGRWLYGDFMLKRSTTRASRQPRNRNVPHLCLVRAAQWYRIEQGQPAGFDDVWGLLTSEVPDSVRDAMNTKEMGFVLLSDDEPAVEVTEDGERVVFHFANQAARTITLKRLRNIVGTNK